MKQKQKKIWMALVIHKGTVELSKVFKSNQRAVQAIIRHLQKNWNFDGDDIQDACSWVGDSNLTLDFMTFEMDRRDFEGTGLLIEPLPEENNQPFVQEKKMRKVTLKLQMRVVMSVDEGIEISEVVNELDYHISDTTTAADILDTEIIDYEIEDSK